MLPAALALAVIMVPSYLASIKQRILLRCRPYVRHQHRLGADTAAIEETFGKSDTWVVLVPEGDTATQAELSDALHAIPEVTGILSYVDNAGASIPPEFVPPDTLKLLVSGGYTRMVLTVNADTEGRRGLLHWWTKCVPRCSSITRMRMIWPGRREHLRPDGHHHGRHGQGEPAGHRRSIPDPAPHEAPAAFAYHSGAQHSRPAIWINLAIRTSGASTCSTLPISSSARCSWVLRWITPSSSPTAIRSSARRWAAKKPLRPRCPARDHLGQHHWQRHGGSGLPDGSHFHKPAAGPAGAIFWAWAVWCRWPSCFRHCRAFLYLADPLIIKKKKQPKEA